MGLDFEDENPKKYSYASILALNNPEIFLNICGCLSSFGVGAIQPLFAIIFAGILGVFGTYACSYDLDIENEVKNWADNPMYSPFVESYKTKSFCSDSAMMELIVFWSLMFVAIGGACFVGFAFFAIFFAFSGEKMTMRLRKKSFDKLMHMDIGYFDWPENCIASLTGRLATDASLVQGAIGTHLAIIMQSLGAITCSLVIGFLYEWRLTLVCVAFLPFMIGSTILMMKSHTGRSSKKDQKAFEEAGKCATEATMNLRMVTALTREDFFVDKYQSELRHPLASLQRKSYFFGLFYGFSVAILFFMYAVTFYVSSYLIENDLIKSNDFENVFKVLMAIVFGAMTAGQSGAMAPDFGEACAAARRILKLMDEESKIENDDTGLIPESCKGRIEFKNVGFKYPTRRNSVLRDVCLDIKAGETVALVGQSGCGKSTCIQLIERFYSNSKGMTKSIYDLEHSKYRRQHQNQILNHF